MHKEDNINACYANAQRAESVAISGFLPGGGEFFLEIFLGGGDNLPGGGEKIAL